MRIQKARVYVHCVALLGLWIGGAAVAPWSLAQVEAAEATTTDQATPDSRVLSEADRRLVEAFCAKPQRDYFAIYDDEAKAGWSLSKIDVVEIDGQRVMRYRDVDEIVGRYFGELQTERHEYLVECELSEPFRLLRMEQRVIERGFEKSTEVLPDPEGGEGAYIARISEAGRTRIAPLEFSSQAGKPRALTIKDVLTAELAAMRGDPPGTRHVFLNFDTWELQVREFVIEIGAPPEGSDLLVSLSVSNEDQGTYLDATMDRRGQWLDYAFRTSFRYQSVATAAEAKANLGDYEIQASEEILSSKALGDPSRISRMVISLPGDWRSVMPDTDLQRVSYDASEDLTRAEVRSGGFEGEELNDKSRREALRATGEYPVNDPALKKLAEEIVADATSDLDKVERLSAYVTRVLNYQVDLDPLSVQEALAAKRGDCSEHSALFATLARAIGLPARSISGWVYGGDEPPSFGFHAWNEVAVDGRWRSLDSTWNEFRPNATHLRCELNDGDIGFWTQIEDGVMIEVESFENSPVAAAAEVARLIEKYPREAAWYAQRGELLGDEEGLRDLQRTVELAPDVAEFHENLAYKLWDAGRVVAATSAMERAAELVPENAGYWFTLSDLYYALDDHESSLLAVDRLIELQPRNAEHHVERALVFLAMEDAEGVSKAVEAALKLRPGLPRANFIFGISLLRNENFAEAREKLRAAADREPDNIEYWESWAESFSNGDELPHDELEKVVSALAQATDEDFEAIEGLMRDLLDVDQASVMAEFAESQVDAAGENSVAWRLLRSEALLATERGDEALVEIARIIDADEGLAVAHYLRGRVLGEQARSSKDSKFADAKAALRRAQEIEPGDGRFPVALAVLLRAHSERGEHFKVLEVALEELAGDEAQLQAFATECYRAGFRTFGRKAEDRLEAGLGE